jgi:hypothetical protein
MQTKCLGNVSVPAARGEHLDCGRVALRSHEARAQWTQIRLPQRARLSIPNVTSVGSPWRSLRHSRVLPNRAGFWFSNARIVRSWTSDPRAKKHMTWLDNIRKLASNIALAAIGTAPFYSVVQVLL